MGTTNIFELPIVPEEYRRDIYDRNDWSDIDSEMTDGQRRFINGLIQYYQPQKILELGVSAGGGTVVLLNALAETDGILYSVDSATQFYRNPDLPVGHCAIEKYGELLNKKWYLLTGKDPANVMESINEKFDFCVIDTYHHHPVEVLNFITILPWLKDSAVVVMHDTTAFEWRSKETFLHMLSPRLLLSAVCAPKYIPNLPSGNMSVSNIAAWQVDSDTRKYCQNLFDVLYFPWEVTIPKITYQAVGHIVKRYYSQKLCNYYEEAVRINKSMFLAKQFKVLDFEKGYKQLREDTIFYGAGAQMHLLLEVLDLCDVDFNFSIWDRNAKKIQKIGKYIVSEPDFTVDATAKQIMIITIDNNKIFEELYNQFNALGYTIFHGLSEYLISSNC